MKRAVLFLVVGLPCTALAMGALMLFLAFSEPDRGVRYDGTPLSKTSWQEPKTSWQEPKTSWQEPTTSWQEPKTRRPESSVNPQEPE
jgi:hypothetical protein